MTEVCEKCGSPADYRVKRGQEDEFFCHGCLRIRDEGQWLPLLNALRRPRRAAGKCPNCGWTDSQLGETGLVGCPLCYEALDRRILAGFAPKPD